MMQSASAGQPVMLQGQPGASVSVPQYYYPAGSAGSVDVPIYMQQVSAQRVYQQQATHTPVAYTGATLTQDQLKMIFPMGAPTNFAPAAPAPPVVVSSPDM